MPQEGKGKVWSYTSRPETYIERNKIVISAKNCSIFFMQCNFFIVKSSNKNKYDIFIEIIFILRTHSTAIINVGGRNIYEGFGQYGLTNTTSN